MPDIQAEIGKELETRGYGGAFTVDCCATATNRICEKFYSKDDSFLDATIGFQADGSPHTLWCNPPFTSAADALPFVLHVYAQVQAHPGTVGIVIFPDWLNTEAYKFLQTQEVVKQYPAGTRLFSMPHHKRLAERSPMRGTRWPVTIYAIRAANDVRLQASSAGPPTQAAFTFPGSIMGGRVYARTGFKFTVSEGEADTGATTTTCNVEALADTGADECITTYALVRHLGLRLLPCQRARRVVLGDNASSIPVVGTCEFKLRLGRSETVVQALVIDVAWGSKQHVVLGANWIERNNVMVGVSNNKGPQLQIGGPDGKQSCTVYARKPLRSAYSQHVTHTDSYTPVGACEFAAMLAEPGTDDTDGTPWAAVDVTTEGVVIGHGPRIPLAEFQNMSLEEVNAAAETHVRLWQSRVEEPPPLSEEARAGAAEESSAKPTHTPAGVPMEHLANYQKEFPSVFQADLPDRDQFHEEPPVPETIHTIPLLPDAKPVYRKQWRLSPREYEEVMKHVKYLLDKGLIEPSSSPWCAPILFAPKSDGTLRLCIDYRGLNAVTERDVYPLPKGEEMYSRVKGKKIFSTLDLLKGYHQIWIQDKDRHFTAFATPKGLHQWKVLPMGLTNAPATFQRMMQRLFHDLIDAGDVMVYLDDILVMANTVEEHDRIMREVLSRLASRKLVVRFDKCKFGESHVNFLGNIISGESVAPDPKKVQAVKDWPVPETVTGIRGFLGLSNYFRRFIKGYATLCAPLTARSSGKGKERVQLNAEEIQAFEAVKDALVNAPILGIEDPTLPYEVWTDASTVGIGAVLLQRAPDGTPRVIAYESKKLGRKRASVRAKLDPSVQIPLQTGCISLDRASLEDASGKQELAAVLHALNVWRCYLEGADFTVFVDHNPLTYLLEKKELNRWQVRILDTLVTYPGLKISHIPGKENIADGLSRIPHPDLPEGSPFTAMTTEALADWAKHPDASLPGGRGTCKSAIRPALTRFRRYLVEARVGDWTEEDQPAFAQATTRSTRVPPTP